MDLFTTSWVGLPSRQPAQLLAPCPAWLLDPLFALCIKYCMSSALLAWAGEARMEGLDGRLGVAASCYNWTQLTHALDRPSYCWPSWPWALGECQSLRIGDGWYHRCKQIDLEGQSFILYLLDLWSRMICMIWAALHLSPSWTWTWWLSWCCWTLPPGSTWYCHQGACEVHHLAVLTLHL